MDRRNRMWCMLTVRKEHRVWIREDWVFRRFEVALEFGGGATMTPRPMEDGRWKMDVSN